MELHGTPLKWKSIDFLQKSMDTFQLGTQIDTVCSDLAGRGSALAAMVQAVGMCASSGHSGERRLEAKHHTARPFYATTSVRLMLALSH